MLVRNKPPVDTQKFRLRIGKTIGHMGLKLKNVEWEDVQGVGIAICNSSCHYSQPRAGLSCCDKHCVAMQKFFASKDFVTWGTLTATLPHHLLTERAPKCCLMAMTFTVSSKSQLGIFGSGHTMKPNAEEERGEMAFARDEVCYIK